MAPKFLWKLWSTPLVSHYSAIGDTISCDTPYSTMGFRGRLFLRYPPCQVCLWIAIGHFYGKKWGCTSDSLRYHRKCSATGVLLHLSRDRGGYFGRVAKSIDCCARIPPERSSREIFVRDLRKMRRNFGEFFCRFSSCNFQGKWPQKNSRKIIDIFHTVPNRVFSLLQLWGLGDPIECSFLQGKRAQETSCKTLHTFHEARHKTVPLLRVWEFGSPSTIVHTNMTDQKKKSWGNQFTT